MKKFLVVALAGLAAGSVTASEVTLDRMVKEAQKLSKLSAEERITKVKDIGSALIKSRSKKSYPKDTNISFELYNKSPKPIYFLVSADNEDLSAEGKPVTEKESQFLEIGSMEVGQIPVDVSKQVSIMIANTVTGKYEMYVIDPAGRGKTLYLTYDGKKPLRPQTGPGLGFFKMTNSGFDMSNNVSAADIKKVKEVDIPSQKKTPDQVTAEGSQGAAAAA